MKARRFGIGAKLGVLYLIIAVPLIAVIGISYTLSYRDQTRAFIRDRTDIARLTSTNFVALVNDISHTAHIIGLGELEGHYTPAEASDSLRRLTTQFPVDHAFTTDADGRVVSATDSSRLGEDLSGDRRFTEVLAGKRATAIQPVEVQGSVRGFYYVTAIRREGGAPLGAVAVFIDAQRLSKALPLEVTGGGSNIVDSRGQLVFQSESTDKDIYAYPWAKQPFIREALAGRTSSSTDWINPVDGSRRIISEVPIGEFGWAAGASVRYWTALGPVFVSLLQATLLTGIVLLVGLATGWLISRRIVQSLQRLSHSAEVVGQMRLDEPVVVRSNDQIEDVARSLEHTRLNLKSYVEGLSGLSDISRQLTRSLEPEDVRAAILAGAEELFGADTVITYVRGDSGDELVPALLLGEGADEFAEIRPVAGQGPLGTVFSSGAPALIRDISRAPEGESKRAAQRVGITSLAVIPLMLGDEPLGVMALASPDAAHWSPEGREMELASIFASQVANAFENSRLFRERALLLEDVHRERTLAVQRAIESRRRADELDAIIRAIADTVLVYDASGTAIKANEAATRNLGIDPTTLSREDVVSIGHVRWPDGTELAVADFPSSRALRGEPVVDQLFLMTAADGSDRFIRVSATPLHEAERLVGVVAIWHDVTQAERERRFDEALNSISQVVNSTLDAEAIMGSVIVEAARALEVEAATVAQHERGEWRISYVYGWPDDLVGRTFTDADSDASMMTATRMEPVWSNDAQADDRFDSDLFTKRGIRSFLHVPLVVRGRVTGIMSFQQRTRTAPFTNLHVRFARSLATSLSLALENARLYTAERDIADTLQESLLQMPEAVEGVDFGWLYRSATEAAKVGGDFFDIFELEHDRLGLIIGDVSGKGLAAATLTSLVKNTLRAYAYEEDSPAVVVSKTNDTVARIASESSFVTVMFGVLERATGKLCYCSAGHPPAVMRRRSSVTSLLKANSPLVGAFSHLRFNEDEEVLEPGDILLMYTDGVTETRCSDGLFGEARLLRTVHDLVDPTAQTIPDMVFDRVKQCAGGRLSDDIALFAVSLAPASAQDQRPEPANADRTISTQAGASPA